MVVLIVPIASIISFSANNQIDAYDFWFYLTLPIMGIVNATHATGSVDLTRYVSMTRTIKDFDDADYRHDR